MEALTHQKEVLGLDVKSMNDKLSDHAKWANAGLDKGMRSLSLDLQHAVVTLCSSVNFPNRAGCITNKLEGFDSSISAIVVRKQNNPSLKYGDLLAEDGTELGSAAGYMCPNSKGDHEACLEKSLIQIQSDARNGASYFAAAYHDLSAIAVQTLYCEDGTDTVFPIVSEPKPQPRLETGPIAQPDEGTLEQEGRAPLKKDHFEYPEPANRGWKGFGAGSCPVATYAKMALPAGPFPYDGAAANELAKPAQQFQQVAAERRCPRSMKSEFVEEFSERKGNLREYLIRGEEIKGLNKLPSKVRGEEIELPFNSHILERGAATR